MLLTLVRRALTALTVALAAPGVVMAAEPVRIGISAEFGHLTSTSDDAIRAGIRMAIEDINRAGGVLGGRPLELVERDDRSVPARMVANVEALAAVPDLVAMFCGKFSPAVLNAIPTVHQEKMILLDPWAAADAIIDNGHQPNYAFRLSLRDTWAIDKLLERASDRGMKRIGLLLPNTAWGRSSLKAAEQYVARHPDRRLVATTWYNWGDKTLAEQYAGIRSAGADAILLVANELEGALLVREVAARPVAERLPILSHWGVTGGDIHRMSEGRISEVDFEVVQSFSFKDATRPSAQKVAAEAMRFFGVPSPERIPSAVGLAHAYDLTHLLAQAINRAGTTARPAVRDALEQLGPYEGLIRHYSRPFTPERHEALEPGLLRIMRYGTDGALLPIAHR